MHEEAQSSARTENQGQSCSLVKPSPMPIKTPIAKPKTRAAQSWTTTSLTLSAIPRRTRQRRRSVMIDKVREGTSGGAVQSTQPLQNTISHQSCHRVSHTNSSGAFLPFTLPPFAPMPMSTSFSAATSTHSPYQLVAPSKPVQHHWSQGRVSPSIDEQKKSEQTKKKLLAISAAFPKALGLADRSVTVTPPTGLLNMVSILQVWGWEIRDYQGR
jgi:hypothetical protein